jgi:hypothetical protein
LRKKKEHCDKKLKIFHLGSISSRAIESNLEVSRVFDRFLKRFLVQAQFCKKQKTSGSEKEARAFSGMSCNKMEAKQKNEYQCD